MNINKMHSTRDVQESSTKSNAKMLGGGSKVETGLSVNDFLQLLAAQLQNQDMMNPMKDTEFMSQLAQFTSLQAMQELNETGVTSYASSLLGQEVTAAAFIGGKLETTEGVVTAVSFFNGSPMIYIGDKEFYLQEIMAVGKLPEPKPEEKPEEKPESKPEETPDGFLGGVNNTDRLESLKDKLDELKDLNGG